MIRKMSKKNQKTRKYRKSKLVLYKGGAIECTFYKKYIGKTFYLGIDVEWTGNNLEYNLNNVLLPRYENGDKTRFGSNLFIHDGFDWDKAQTIAKNDTSKSDLLKTKEFDEKMMLDVIYDEYKVLKTNIFEQFEKRKEEEKREISASHMGKIFIGIQAFCSMQGPNSVSVDKESEYKDNTNAQIHFKVCEFIVPQIVGENFINIDSLLLFGKKYGNHDISVGNMNQNRVDVSGKIFKILRDK